MNINNIVEALDSEIGRLRLVRDLLSEQGSTSDPTVKQTSSASVAPKKRGRPAGSKNKSAGIVTELPVPRRGGLSPAAKERIAAAQRERWARQKAAAKKAARIATKAASNKVGRTQAPKSTSSKKTLTAPKSKPPQLLTKAAVGGKNDSSAAAKKPNTTLKVASASSSKKAAGPTASASTKGRSKSVTSRRSAVRQGAEKPLEAAHAIDSASSTPADLTNATE